jgi:hypothetical protein
MPQEVPDNIKNEICVNVDWIWLDPAQGGAGDAAPASLGAWLVKIPVGAGITSIRGPLGARTCGNYAVLWALAGDNGKALEWLKVCQSHNDHAKQLFSQYPHFTVDYAKKHHERDAVTQLGILTAGMGFPVPLHYITGALNALKGHNPDPNPPQFREAAGRMRTGEERGGSGDRKR